MVDHDPEAGPQRHRGALPVNDRHVQMHTNGNETSGQVLLRETISSRFRTPYAGIRHQQTNSDPSPWRRISLLNPRSTFKKHYPTTTFVLTDSPAVYLTPTRLKVKQSSHHTPNTIRGSRVDAAPPLPGRQTLSR
jgi:hypothetical protein